MIVQGGPMPGMRPKSLKTNNPPNVVIVVLGEATNPNNYFITKKIREDQYSDGSRGDRCLGCDLTWEARGCSLNKQRYTVNSILTSEG